jgi:hypothetical protein
MSFLNNWEHSKLFGILEKYDLFAEDVQRNSVLIICELEHLAKIVPQKATKPEFANWLFAQLKQDLYNNGKDKPAFAKVLSNLIAVPCNLQPEELLFLEQIINKCQQFHAAPYNAYEPFNQELAQLQVLPQGGRPRKRSRTHAHVNQNFREMIITQYDLDEVIKEFRSIINFEKACAFVIEQEHNLLRDYVFTRVQKEFYEKMRRMPYPVNVYLYKRDYLAPPNLETIIEEEVKSAYECKTLGELFIMKHPHEHILCTVWNDYLPAADMQYAVNAFWQKVKSLMLPHLHLHRLCFILFLAHLPNDGITHIDDFTTLQLPSRFVIEDDLVLWVKGHLSKLNVKEDDIGQYVRMFNNPHAQFLETFRQLEHIVKEVQENYNQGKYNRRRSDV